ncbi:hypothetical protein KZ810_03510 [Sphingomonas sp. RHCKR47]|uniref:hypothetical protein n=1 Tax=Sphingomonas citricola TaxID=2862498 RepID=UPI001CA56292|nr:hypothetical protein [Sphingomonas citricola]MBW6522554.1 hypothetical protein [Sphingomonas citricola]
MKNGRNVPAIIVAILGGVLISMMSGMLLASYAVAGVTPNYLPTPSVHSARVVRDEHDTFAGMTTVQQIAERVDAAHAGGQEL